MDLSRNQNHLNNSLNSKMKRRFSTFALIATTLFFSQAHLKAQTWTKSSPTNQSVWKVWGTDAQNVWISGNSGVIQKWNGTSWTNQSVGTITGQRYGLWGTSNTNIYSVGGSTGQQIAQYNGTSWSIVSAAVTAWGSGTARSVWGTSENNVFVTGGSGRVLKYNGSSWAMQSAGLDAAFSGQTIWGLDASNIWVVGATGGDNTGIIYKWNIGSSSWAAQTSGINVVRSIWGASASDVWAVGGDAAKTGGKIYRFNGTTWSDVTPSGELLPMLFSIWGEDKNNIWAVGDLGIILFWDGTEWKKQTSNTTQRLYSVNGAGSSSSLWVTAEASSDNVLSSSQPVTPLPLNLVSFKADALENHIALRWSTSQEINTDRIEVEVATENLQFRSFSSAPTKGNDKIGSNHYSAVFFEAEVNQTYYFRLKMIDADGSFAYSKIITAERYGAGTFVYPNPASDYLYLPADYTNKLNNIQIFHLSGHLVLSKHNGFKERISIKSLPSGEYLIKLNKKDGSSSSRRFFIRK